MKHTTIKVTTIRIVTIALAASFALPALAAPATGFGDARAMGMAGAMTAVNDDMNTLFYNPAGLSFLRKVTATLGTDALASFNQGLLAEPVLPVVFERVSFVPGITSLHYSNWNSFLGTWVPFEFDSYRAELAGFMKDLGQGGDYDSLDKHQKFELYNKYAAMRGTYDSLGDIGPAELHPRLLLGGRYWGLALTGDYRMDPMAPVGFQGLDTEVDLAVTRNLAAVAGLGIQLGPMAIGANVRYLNTSNYAIPFRLRDLAALSSSGLGGTAPDLASLAPVLGYAGAGLESTDSIKAGLGFIFTQGILNLSIYNADILPFLDKANSGLSFSTAYLKAMSLGFSFMPSDDKFAKGKFPLVFSADIDFSNVGDGRLRELAAGIEAGFNAGDYLVALLRIGYGQPLPGDFADMLTVFDPDLGYVTAGISARILSAKLEVAASFPTGMVTKLGTYGSMTAIERGQSFGNLGVGLSLNL
jgi:hypothetical protein